MRKVKIRYEIIYNQWDGASIWCSEKWVRRKGRPVEGIPFLLAQFSNGNDCRSLIQYVGNKLPRQIGEFEINCILTDCLTSCSIKGKSLNIAKPIIKRSWIEAADRNEIMPASNICDYSSTTLESPASGGNSLIPSCILIYTECMKFTLRITLVCILAN